MKEIEEEEVAVVMVVVLKTMDDEVYSEDGQPVTLRNS